MYTEVVGECVWRDEPCIESDASTHIGVGALKSGLVSMLAVCDEGSSASQILTALDRADRELGFMHGDMRIANIMEHRPDEEGNDDEANVPRGFRAKGKKHGAEKRAIAERRASEAEREDGAGELLSGTKFRLPGVC